MKRTISTLLTTALFVVLTFVPARANGTCTANSHKPVKDGQNVDFSGTITCGTYLHKIFVVADLYRRTPGSGWLWWDGGGTSGTATKLTFSDTSAGYNCAKDYKVITEGYARDIGSETITHPNLKDNGSTSILFHTC